MNGKVLELESERLARIGKEDGREEGRNLLSAIDERICDGETPEQILASGVDREND